MTATITTATTVRATRIRRGSTDTRLGTTMASARAVMRAVSAIRTTTRLRTGGKPAAVTNAGWDPSAGISADTRRAIAMASVPDIRASWAGGVTGMAAMTAGGLAVREAMILTELAMIVTSPTS